MAPCGSGGLIVLIA